VLEIVWVGGPWSLVVEGSFRIGIVFVEGISLRVEDAYRVLELCAGTCVNYKLAVIWVWSYSPQACWAACILDGWGWSRRSKANNVLQGSEYLSKGSQ
jgi:short subunit fatty acids transporter